MWRSWALPFLQPLLCHLLGSQHAGGCPAAGLQMFRSKVTASTAELWAYPEAWPFPRGIGMGNVPTVTLYTL